MLNNEESGVSPELQTTTVIAAKEYDATAEPVAGRREGTPGYGMSQETYQQYKVVEVLGLSGEWLRFRWYSSLIQQKTLQAAREGRLLYAVASLESLTEANQRRRSYGRVTTVLMAGEQIADAETSGLQRGVE